MNPIDERLDLFSPTPAPKNWTSTPTLEAEKIGLAYVAKLSANNTFFAKPMEKNEKPKNNFSKLGL